MLSLLPFGVLSKEFDLKGKKDGDGNLIENDLPHKEIFKNNIPKFVVQLYSYWKDLREKLAVLEEMENERDEPYTRELPKIGRNDPCHCGSGKKFKKCCYLDSKLLH